MGYDKDQFDEIDKLFDSVFKDESQISPEEIRRRVNRSYHSTTPRYNRRDGRTRRVQITRPSLSRDVRNKKFNSRFDYFEAYVTNIDYPSQMNYDYERGFHAAVDKYFERAQAHRNNLVMVENLVHDELRRYSFGRNTTNLYNRGYSNGLEYVEGSLKKSKKKIEDEITEILGNSILKN